MTAKYPFFSALLFVILMTVTSAQSLPDFDCTAIYTGRFFQYKKENQLYSTIVRQDSLQTEINTQTGDTSYWKIRWTDNCTFSCQYLSGLKSKSEQELDFYKQSILFFKIKTLEKDYYTYDAELKFNSQSNTFSDTLWRRTK